MKCPTDNNQYATEFLSETFLVDIHIHRNFQPDQGPQNDCQCDICGEWHLTNAVTIK